MTGIECNHKWVDISTLSDPQPRAKCTKCRATRYGKVDDDEPVLLTDEESRAFDDALLDDDDGDIDRGMTMVGIGMIAVIVAFGILIAYVKMKT